MELSTEKYNLQKGQGGEANIGARIATKRRQWLNLITIEGSFATVFIVLTGGAFLTGFGLMLGANDFEIALLAAIPFLAQVAQILSAYWIELTGKRKYITVLGSALSRQIWWLLIPICFFAGNWRLGILIGILVFSSIWSMIATAGWLSWIADLVPDKLRGRYFGRRNAAVALATILASIFGGVMIDHLKTANHENIGFAIIFGIACLFALIALLLLNRLPDIKPISEKTKMSLRQLTEPLREKKFMHLVGVFLAWNIAIGVTAPFFAAQMLTNLRMTFTQVSLYSSLSALVAILLNRPWGIIIDRVGSKPVIVFCAFGISIIPLIWLFPRAGFLWPLIPEDIYSGALWTGFSLAAFNIPIANSPKESRTKYLAMFSVITGLGFFVSSLLGGTIAQSLSHIHRQVGKQTIVNYHIMFVITSVLRFMAAILSLSFHEPQEKPMPVMLHYMGYSALKWLSPGRQIAVWFAKAKSEISNHKPSK